MTVRIDGTNSTANPAITGADTDTGLQLGTDEIQFVTGGTNRATVESNGNLTIEDGNLVVADGHGIDFSNTANSSGSMSSELLDDYEEGTWTPTFSEEGNASFAVDSYEHQSGHYTKIGTLVYIYGVLRPTGTSNASTGALLIDGLPFTPVLSSTNGHSGGRRYMNFIVIGGSGAPTNEAPHSLRLENNTTSARCFKWDDLTNLDQIASATAAMLRSGGDTHVAFFGSYPTT